MSDFDIDRAMRWARFDPGKTLARRKDEQLPFLGSAAEAGPELLLDSCVYIDQLQGRAPSVVEDLMDARSANHSTVALQELLHGVGALDPGHPGSKGAVRQITRLIRTMRPHRIFNPDSDVLGRAAILSGIMSRLQGYGREARSRALQDCTIFLQAQKLGLTVLTANVRDFDCLLQLVPAGRVLLYRST